VLYDLSGISRGIEGDEGRMNYYDAGEVWVNGKRRQFATYREIMKGRNKGKLEVTFFGDKKIVSKNDIERYPKGE